ncbi:MULTISPECIES: hypothetical protein [unclassified Streptomyces]|uniref:hypothetical protein n=1 Tax=unclassified Streptomyces TaxID=2593676 RepID=UPI0038136BFA
MSPDLLLRSRDPLTEQRFFDPTTSTIAHTNHSRTVSAHPLLRSLAGHLADDRNAPLLDLEHLSATHPASAPRHAALTNLTRSIGTQALPAPEPAVREHAQSTLNQWDTQEGNLERSGPDGARSS